jgi:hypothetical protein
MKLSMPKVVREILPATRPAATAAIPSSAFQLMVEVFEALRASSKVQAFCDNVRYVVRINDCESLGRGEIRPNTY